MNNRISMFLLGATLALGFCCAAYMMSNAVVKLRAENSIRVKGYSEAAVKADSVQWDVRVKVEDADLKAAYARLSKDVEAVRARLAKAGLGTENIAVQSIDIDEVRKSDSVLSSRKNGPVEYYVLEQKISVASNDVALIDALSKSVTELIGQGLHAVSGHPSFTYSKLEDLKLDLLAKAAKNARERALSIAGNSGGTTGGLKSASQGIFQIVPVNSTEVADGGTYDTSTIDKSVKAVVTLEFDVLK